MRRVVKKVAPSKLVLLNTIFVTSLVIANVVSAKVLQLGPLQVPGAALCYCITFLCTDIIGEIWGKEEASRTVKYGFICQCMASLLILLTQYLPVAPYAQNVSDAYVTLLGTNWRFFLASMAGYLVSQSWDVWVFHKLKARDHGKRKWLRNNLSTMTSQFLDTIIFIVIAFYGVVPNIWVMVISQYLLKLVLALLDTPIFYLCTRSTSKNN